MTPEESIKTGCIVAGCIIFAVACVLVGIGYAWGMA